MTIDDTLAYLTGTWALHRTIADHRSGRRGAFEGEGRVRAERRRGRYEEHGRLRFGLYAGSAQRALNLVGSPGGAVAVQFVDGRPFFELNLVTGACAATHHCRLDRYELRYEVASPDVLVERWRVTGPDNDYEAETTWRRRSSGAPSG
jgi:Family of unknown function (DUF6314)